jgi:predicted protein tyrosine phosphatase
MILVVCTYGQIRSKYLAEYLHKKGYHTTYKGISKNAVHPLQQQNIEDANIIIAVTPEIKNEILQRYSTHKKIITLNIPYTHTKDEIENQIQPYLKELP